MPCGQEGRDQGDAAGVNQHQKLSATHQQLEDKFSPTALRGKNPVDTLISDFWLQSWEIIHFCCLNHPGWGNFVTAAVAD